MSLAKGLGAPIAVLAGSRATVKQFEFQSETRIHSSPPSVAHIRAAFHALAQNQVLGEGLRQILVRHVTYLRDLLGAAGFSLGGSLVPIQTLGAISRHQAR